MQISNNNIAISFSIEYKFFDDTHEFEFKMMVNGENADH